MPEGHLIHRVARDHTKWFGGQALEVSSPQGRFADEAVYLDGARLDDVDAYGKHLVYRWNNGLLLHIHLGLYGKFRLHKNPPPEPRGAVRVRMVGDDRAFDLNGPTRCEILSDDGLSTLLARLGPDPLRKDADPERAWAKIQRSRAPIGTLLLNQSVIAGLGNIYRAEIPFLLGIHPDRAGQDIDRTEFDQIWEKSVELLRIGEKYKRIITVPRDRVQGPLSRLPAGARTLIYKRSSCPNCSGAIRQWMLANRKVFACDHCQR